MISKQTGSAVKRESRMDLFHLKKTRKLGKPGVAAGKKIFIKKILKRVCSWKNWESCPGSILEKSKDFRGRRVKKLLKREV